MLPRLSYNTLVLLLSNVLTAILAFFLTMLIGRGLGDNGLGRYATIMAWIFPVTILSDFGNSTLITRDIAQNRSLTAFYIQQALWWRWSLGGGIVLLVWIVAPPVSSDREIVTGLRIASFLTLIDTTFGVYTAVWRAWEIMWPILILNTGLLSLQVAGTAFALWQEWGLQGVLVALVVADGLQLLATWLLWQWKFKPHTPQIENTGGFRINIEFLKRAYPFATGGLLATIYTRMIFLLLETHTNAETVGWFAAASRFIEATKMPTFALSGAVFPLMSTLAREPLKFHNLLKWVNVSLVIYGLSGGMVFTLFSSRILSLTFGREFQNATPILMLMAWTLIPALLRQNFAMVHYALHHEKIINQMMLIILPVQFLLGTLLIQKMGVCGAAWTLLCTESLLVVWLWLSYRGRSYANRASDSGVFRQ